MTTEEKFNAAVNVIRSLPKNGSYQPSHELMLRFYGYFKQATQGECTGPSPAFWDIVGKAKYNAWKKLGKMSKTDAMAKYVDELHTIVETMSYSDKVANFLDAPTNELDSLNIEDLQLVVGDVIERVRSQPNSPLMSRESSPNRLISSLSSSRSVSPTTEEDSDHSDGEYVDTIETLEPKKYIPNGDIPSIQTNGHGGHKSRWQESRSDKAKSKVQIQSSVDISQEVARAVQSIKMDIEHLTSKVNAIEKRKISAKQKGPFGISFPLLTFILVWPFVANFIIHRFSKRRA